MSQTVAKEPDLRDRLNGTKSTDNTPTAEEEETNQQEEPMPEKGELAPTSNEMSNVVRHDLIPEPYVLRAAVYKERDDDRPLSLPSPIYPRHDDPEMIAQTPPGEQNNKKTHSPITFNTPQIDTPRRPVKDRLGEKPHTVTNRRQDYHQDETPRRPVKDRLGVRKSKGKNKKRQH